MSHLTVLYRAFCDKFNKVRADHLFSLLFDKALTRPPGANEKDCVNRLTDLLPGVQWLNLPLATEVRRLFLALMQHGLLNIKYFSLPKSKKKDVSYTDKRRVMFFKEGQNFPTLDLLLFLQYWYTFLIYIPCFRQTQSTDYEPSLYYAFINKRNGVFLEAKTQCFMDFSCHTSCERDHKQ